MNTPSTQASGTVPAVVTSALLADLRASADAERAFGNQHAELLTQAADRIENLTNALIKIAAGEEADPHALSWGHRTMEVHELREIASSALANAKVSNAHGNEAQ